VLPGGQAGDMVLDGTPREAALRRLPLKYSLALRLRDAGTAPEVVSEYLGVEQDALPGLYRLAEEKLGGLLLHPQQPMRRTIDTSQHQFGET
jgi:hypothetical protein